METLAVVRVARQEVPVRQLGGRLVQREVLERALALLRPDVIEREARGDAGEPGPEARFPLEQLEPVRVPVAESLSSPLSRVTTEAAAPAACFATSPTFSATTGAASRARSCAWLAAS